MASGERRVRVAIVGGGFSGALLAVHLLARPDGPHVALIDRRGGFARGLAYSTGNPDHLLNVRAGNMSAFPDRPGHFLAWLRRAGLPVDPAGFVPRGVYGTYLEHLLLETCRGAAGRVTLVADTALALVPRRTGVTVGLDRGRPLAVDAAVLATGHLPSAPPASASPSLLASPAYAGDPWAPGALAGLPPEAPVLLLGTGLTMVDMALALQGQGHRGPVVALSRRGLLPQTHGPAPATPATDPYAHLPAPASLSGWLRRVREVAAGLPDWRPAIDALRPRTRTLWQGLSPAERSRFLRHLRPWWEVHRHRLAPAVADRLADALADRRLEVLAGGLEALELDGDAAVARVRLRGGGDVRTLRVARVVNCCGPGGDIGSSRDPLLQGLLAAGLARPDPLRLGLDVAEDGALYDASGHPSPRLFAIGPPTRGCFWEITAVPDLRLAAAALADRLDACPRPEPVRRAMAPTDPAAAYFPY